MCATFQIHANDTPNAHVTGSLFTVSITCRDECENYFNFGLSFSTAESARKFVERKRQYLSGPHFEVVKNARVIFAGTRAECRSLVRQERGAKIRRAVGAKL